MHFFELRAPEYVTDSQYSRQNPVIVTPKYHIPSIKCDKCGIWASSDRIRLDLNYEQRLPFTQNRILNVSEWKSAVKSWANSLRLKEETITPGAELGIPETSLSSIKFNDFIHPMPGQVFASKRVVTLLRKLKATGINLIPLEPTWDKTIMDTHLEPPELWEIQINGQGWRIGVNQNSIVSCSICGRKIFPDMKMTVDEKKWDGSDFFNIDQNPNIIIVTQRIYEAFQDSGFSNYQCIALD